MVERNLSEAALGDLPHQLGKRGCFDREKGGIESFSDIDVAKRVCISLEGSVASSVSNIHGENRDGDLSEFGCGACFKSLVDVGTDCDNGGCLRGKKSVDGIMVLDLGVEADVSVSVNNELDFANDVVDSRGKIDYFDDGSSPDIDKTASQDDEGPNLADPVGANCCSKPDLLKENEIQAIAEIVCENSGGGGEVSVGTSEKCRGNDNISLMDLDGGNTLNIKAEFGDSLDAGTSRTVSKTGGSCHQDGRDFNVDESKASAEGTLRDINDFQTDRDYHNAIGLIFSKCGQFSCTSSPASQECALSEGTDSIKACSCSFCTKAIRKIQKEVSILSVRSIKSNVIWKQDTESSSQTSKHESELMCQWRPLFECMANVWQEEGSSTTNTHRPERKLQNRLGVDVWTNI